MVKSRKPRRWTRLTVFEPVTLPGAPTMNTDDLTRYEERVEDFFQWRLH